MFEKSETKRGLSSCDAMQAELDDSLCENRKREVEVLLSRDTDKRARQKYESLRDENDVFFLLECTRQRSQLARAIVCICGINRISHVRGLL